MDEQRTQARKALGYHTRESVLYDRWDPPHEGLPVVHFAYVPLTPDEMQEHAKRLESLSRAQAVRSSVQLCARQLRDWDLERADKDGYATGEKADCRNALEIAGHIDNNIVEGIAARILDTRSSAGAQEALANFPKR